MNTSSEHNPIQWTPALVAQKLDKGFFPAGCRIEMACVAVIIYEYVLTFSVEYRLIWRRRLTIPTFLFCFNRYCLLLFALSLAMWAFMIWGDNSTDTFRCRFSGAFQDILGTLLVATNTVFLALRIHIINDHNRFWTALILLLGLVSVPPNILEIVVSRTEILPPPLTGCAITTSDTFYGHPVWLRVAISVQICNYILQLIVIAITWYQTMGTLSAARKAGLRTSLASVVLRDGTTYFIEGLIVNTIVIYFELSRKLSLGIVAITISSILMSRFILDLRTVDQSLHLASISIPAGSALASSLRFTPGAFDNLGAPLSFYDDNNEDAISGEGEDDEEQLMTEDLQDSLSINGGEYRAVNRSDSLDLLDDLTRERS